MTNEVKISRRELERLQDRDFKLTCLENGGVDNWDWYSESLVDYFKQKAMEEAYDNFIESLNDILAEAEVDYPAGYEMGRGYPSISFDEDLVRSILNIFADKLKEFSDD